MSTPLSAASISLFSAHQGLLPSTVLMRHLVCNFDLYTFCVLLSTEASARVSTSLATSFAFPPSPALCSFLAGLAHIHVLHLMSLRSPPRHQCVQREIQIVVLYKKNTITVTDVLFSPLFCHKRLQVASDLVFQPSRNSVGYYVLHSRDMFSFMTPTARHFKSDHSQRSAFNARSTTLTHDTVAALSPQLHWVSFGFWVVLQHDLDHKLCHPSQNGVSSL